jgi:hypothetical protein
MNAEALEAKATIANIDRAKSINSIELNIVISIDGLAILDTVAP